MTNPQPPSPTQSPAERLAAVLRVVQPNGNWATLDGDVGFYHHGNPGVLNDAPVYRPESRDDLARVVGRLTERQKESFDDVLDHPEYGYPTPSHILTLPTATILAALEAAVLPASGNIRA